MAVSDSSFEALVKRVNLLETVLNNILNGMSGFATVEQVRQLNTIRQNDINDLQTRMSGAENNIESLQNLHRI